MSDETMVGVNGVTNSFVSRQASEILLSRSSCEVATESTSRVVAVVVQSSRSSEITE